MNKLRNFFHRQIQLLENDTGLKIFGLILCLTHLVTSYRWWWWTSAPQDTVICYPFFQGCTSFTKFFLLEHGKIILLLYGVMSLFSGIAFLTKKIPLAYGGLFFVTILKLVIHIADYRNMGNYHYMANILGLIYLLAQNKTVLLRIFIILFYLGAGILKFNTDWLAGVSAGSFFIQGKLLEWAQAYVIVLELIFSWFLFSRSKYLRRGALAQFYLFHILSYWIVGYFYPTVMCFFLTIFLLPEVKLPLRLKPIEWSLIGAFLIAQLIPFLLFPTSGLDGQGRVLSLNMFDVKSVCETNIFLKHKNHTVEYNPSFTSLYGIRLQCDPVFLLSHIQKTCEDQRKSGTFFDMDLNHQVRMFTQNEVPVSYTFLNVCSSPLSISFLGHITQEKK